MNEYLKNLGSKEKSIKSYQKAIQFINLIKCEIKSSKKIYNKEDARRLISYYKSTQKGTAYFKYVQHYYAERVKYLIQNISKHKKILDSGCGTGSEAILSGILGAKVVGVDIHRSHLNLAKKRVEYYQSKFKKKIDVKFYLENIFKHSDEYDLIWVNEAISHINPIDDFIDFCYQNLRKEGTLIIADGNILNPYTYLYSKKAQKDLGGVYITQKDTITGEDISSAVERFFTIPSIKKLLLKRFSIKKIIPIGFFPYFVFKMIPKFCKKSESRFLRRFPLINLLSAFYIIICIKR